MTEPSDRFFDVPAGTDDYAAARVAILPVPFERTTSYGHGTAEGPAAIFRASSQVELFEEQLASEPYRLGIASLPPFEPRAAELGAALEELEAEATRHLAAGKFLVTLGGEHSLTIAPVRAARARFGEIGVVQFDAHADLRESYEGTPWSHASVMRRVVETGAPTLAIGIRALSREERELIDARRLPTVWGWQLERAEERFAEQLAQLPERVYLTFDLDYFDPAIMAATGTPVPGGGSWYPTLRMLRTLFRVKEVVAMDVVELAPRPELHGCDFLAADLVYKCLAYLQEKLSAG